MYCFQNLETDYISQTESQKDKYDRHGNLRIPYSKTHTGKSKGSY